MNRRVQRLAPPASLAQRVRWASRVCTAVAILGTTAAVLSGPPRPAVLGVALTGLSWLVWHWNRGWRATRVHWAGDVLDALALLPVVIAAPDSTQVFAMMYSGIFVRTLHPGLVPAVVRATSYMTALFAGVALAAAPAHPDGAIGAGLSAVASSVAGVVFIMAFTALLGTALTRAERTAERDRLLAECGVRLLAAETAADVADEARAAAAVLVAQASSVRVHVVLGPDAGASDAAGPSQPHRQDAPASGRRAWVPFGEHAGLGGLDVQGRPGELREVDQPLVVLAQQVGLALQKCAALEELRRRAETDGLTGLAIREVLYAALDRATQAVATPDRGAGPDSPLATLVIIDCDDFKRVNDTWGHLAGDAVLRTIADRLRLATGTGDVASRLGGDEFAVLLRPAHPTAADLRVEEVSRLLAEPVHVEGLEIPISCTAGAVRVLPGSASTELLRGADVAMYAAKARGGGRRTPSAPAVGPGLGAPLSAR